MFNETSYKTAWQGRQHTRPEAITSGEHVDRFYAPGYGPGVVVESPGFLAPGPPQTAPATPAAGGGIMETISALPTWMLLAGAAGAYFLFFKKGR